MHTAATALAACSTSTTDNKLHERVSAPYGVRATVGRGPGASADAEFRRRRATEWTVWARTLPWRAAVVVGGGRAAGQPGRSSPGRLADGGGRALEAAISPRS